MSRHCCEELVVADDLLVERPRVLGQAQRGERTLPLGQVNRIDRRVADRHHGTLGVDVDGSHVKFEVGLGLQQQELAEPAHRHGRRDAEDHANPVGVNASLERVSRAGDLEACPIRPHARDDKRQPELAGAGPQRILWSNQICADRAAIAGDVMDVAAGRLAYVPIAGGIKREHALCAAEVGNAHGREQHAAQLLGREGDRHTEDAIEDAVLAEDAPERLALAEQPYIGFAQGNRGTFRCGSIALAGGSRPS